MNASKAKETLDDAIRWRRQQARWRFYGELGTLRLMQSKMLGLSQLWPDDEEIQRLTGEIDAKVIALHVALQAHKDSWKEVV